MKGCSIDKVSQLSNTIETHIAQSNECNNKCYENKEVKEYDNKLIVNRTMLSI